MTRVFPKSIIGTHVKAMATIAFSEERSLGQKKRSLGFSVARLTKTEIMVEMMEGAVVASGY